MTYHRVPGARWPISHRNGQALAATWVTLMVFVTTDAPDVAVNVTVADRDDVTVFATAVTVTDPLPVPDTGLIVTHG